MAASTSIAPSSPKANDVTHDNHKSCSHSKRSYSSRNNDHDDDDDTTTSTSSATTTASAGELMNQQALENLVRETLPTDEIVFCFGYGSGVFSQNLATTTSGDDNSNNNNLIDLIVVVRDSQQFHQENYALNPTHYWTPPQWVMASSSGERNANAAATSSAAGAAKWFTSWQRMPQPTNDDDDNRMLRVLPTSMREGNPGVYFNVTDTIKYGVVQAEDLLDDLNDWKYLYLAGRMHKPILPLLNLHNHHQSNNQQQIQLHDQILQAQQESNLPAALSTALLFLSQQQNSINHMTSVTDLEVFHTIAELSYRGDFRTQLAAEDPQKVQKLVQSQGQLQRFQTLYQPVVEQLIRQGFPLEISSSTTSTSTTNTQQDTVRTWTWDDSFVRKDQKTQAVSTILEQHLPRSLQRSAYQSATLAVPHYDWISQQMAHRVAGSAKAQSAKGIITAGPSKALEYVLRKLSKGQSLWSKLFLRRR